MHNVFKQVINIYIYVYIYFFMSTVFIFLLIKRDYSTAQIFMFHSSVTQVSGKLPWNATQRNSLHSKITLHS